MNAPAPLPAQAAPVVNDNQPIAAVPAVCPLCQAGLWHPEVFMCEQDDCPIRQTGFR